MNNDARYDQLSSEGQLRRDAMRQELRSQVVKHRARRRVRRRAAWSVAGVFVLTLSVWGAILATSAMRSLPNNQQIATIDPTSAIPDDGQIGLPVGSDANFHITRVNTTVDVSSVSISDEELLEMLAKMGRRTGIARIKGRTILTQPVTDEEIARAQDTPADSL